MAVLNEHAGHPKVKSHPGYVPDNHGLACLVARPPYRASGQLTRIAYAAITISHVLAITSPFAALLFSLIASGGLDHELSHTLW